MDRNELDDWTASNLFMVPLLSIARYKLNIHGLINSFLINGESEEQLENILYLLFTPPNTDKFNDFIEQEKEESGLVVVSEQDFPPNFVLIGCKLPEEFKEDYKLFWEGKFSKMSKDYKDRIPDKVRMSGGNGKTIAKTSIQHMIFEKNAELRIHWENRLDVVFSDDLELWSIPDPEKETFKLFKHEKSTTGVA